MFKLQVPEDKLDFWADKYWDKNSCADERVAFDAGREILQGGLSDNELRDNLKKIIYWKSPRVVHYFEDSEHNTPQKIKSAIEKAIANKDNVQEAIKALTELRGVGLPVASAIMTAIFPDRFTVIDFRALEALGHDAAGIEFYNQYLSFCLSLSESEKVSPQTDCPAPTALRALDRALWQWSECKDDINAKCKM